MKIEQEIMIRLIELYCNVSDLYHNMLKVEVQRFSPNAFPKFTDEEIIATYFWGIRQGHLQTKAIHTYIYEHWLEWFPALPCYQEYVRRVNFLSPAFMVMADVLMDAGRSLDIIPKESLLDSFPIVLANGKRKRQAKVARECCAEGYCSSKDMHYYGAKLHMIGFRRVGALPMPEYIQVTAANVHDLTAVRNTLETTQNRTFWGDKAYIDQFLNGIMEQNSSVMLTPVKKRKGQSEWETQFSNAANTLFSSAVSRIRQPIESFFNWLEQKVSLQKASSVRSSAGLLTFIFARFAFCLLLLLGII